MEYEPKFIKEDIQEPLKKDKKKQKEKILVVEATNKEDLEEAVDLIVREYQKKGYLNLQEYPDSKEKILASLESEFSRTFIVKHKDKIVGTVSVVFDSERGLPIDEIYKEEMNKLRVSGVKIAEIIKLATDSEYRKNNTVIQSLFTTIFKYGLSEKADYYCITINPKQAAVYKNIFFEKIGEEKIYHFLNDAPTIAMISDFNKVREILITEGLKGGFRKRFRNELFI